jgi:hypothetical protein
VWQADSETCTGATPRYAYHAWPHLAAGRLNSFTIQDDNIEWSITASTEKANTAWAPPLPSPIPLPVPLNAHRGFYITRVTPPAVTGPDCGAQTL